MKNKLMRKLIPALSTLLVAVVVMSTASYAWFTMNKEAKVNGVDLQAKVGGNLLVAYGTQAYSSTNWQSTVNLSQYLNFTDFFLSPSSSFDGSEFYVADKNDIDKGTGAVSSTTTWTKYATEAELANWSINAAKDTTNDVNKTDNGYWMDFTLSFRTVTSSANVIINMSTTKIEGKTAEKESFALAGRFAIVSATITGTGGNTATGIADIAANKANLKDQTTVTDPMGANMIGNKNVFVPDHAGEAEYPSYTIPAVPESSPGANDGTPAEDVVVMGPIANNTTVTSKLIGSDYIGADNSAIVIGEDDVVFFVPESCVVTVQFRVWIEGQSALCVDTYMGSFINFAISFEDKDDPYTTEP